MNKKIKNEITPSDLTKTLFSRREFEMSHLSYAKEFSFYSAVQNGDLELLKSLLVPLTDSSHGNLSKDPLRNLKYHFCIGVAMVARFCVDGGMNHESAYTLSDLYIGKADLSNSLDEINALHIQMAYDYAGRMQKLLQESINSKAIIQCIDYIHMHLHGSITLKKLATHVNLNPSYLSTLFKKETGYSLHFYINERKIDAAKNLLQYSDYPSIDIANYLSFSSHSHFISTFKKHTGFTPRAFRNQKFRSNWK
jgi:AraC-like DNA-binding protein